MVQYTFANNNDLHEISQLLKNSELPYIDIEQSKVEFIVARKHYHIVGCIGIERYRNHALLRSFAVEVTLQNQGLGSELYSRMVLYCEEQQVQYLHLLTSTAREYFLKKDFSIQNRNNAPEAITRTKEFGNLCPATSTYMVKQINKEPLTPQLTTTDFPTFS